MDRDNAQATGLYATTALVKIHGVKWRIKSGMSMPIIADGLLFYSKADYYQGTSKDASVLTAIDVESGKEVWTFKNDSDVFNNVSADSLAYASGTIYAAGSVLYALEANSGRQIWHFLVDRSAAAGQDLTLGAPVIQGDAVYFTINGHLPHQFPGSSTMHALDRASGKEKWSITLPTKLGGGVTNGPYIVVGNDGTVFLSYSVMHVCCEQTNFTLALDPTSGREKWQTNRSGRLITAEGTLFVTSSSEITALDTQTGQVKWHHEFADEGGPTGPAAMSGGLLYFSESSIIHAIDAATGNEVWSTNLSLDSYGGNVGVSPVTIADNVLYVVYTEALNAMAKKYPYVRAIDLQSRKELWSYALTPESSGTSWIYKAPLVADGVVYLSTNPGGPFYALR